jgi:cysteine-rich repeat protein
MKPTTQGVVGLTLLVLVGAFASPLSAGKIYWTGGGVYRADLNGSNVEQLADTGSSGIALDVTGGMMYWGASGSILRAGLDGSNVEEILAGQETPGSVALDVDHGKIYWHEGVLPTGTIRRANLDGSEVEELVAFPVLPDMGGGIDLDLVGQKIYWTENGIWRADLDGSNVEQLPPLPFSLFLGWIALDVTGGKMYWKETVLVSPEPPLVENWIQRANLDGTSPQTVIQLFDDADGGIAVDSEQGKLYWTESHPGGAILRANLDGTDVETLLNGTDSPWDVAVAHSFCGDGAVDPGEECDDGNNAAGDGCGPTCFFEDCGNGIIDPGEECDDGNYVDGDGCSSHCLLEVCGNGILDYGEDCDDGNNVDGDGCASDCRLEEPVPAASSRALLVLVLLLLTITTAVLFWRRRSAT